MSQSSEAQISGCWLAFAELTVDQHQPIPIETPYRNKAQSMACAKDHKCAHILFSYIILYDSVVVVRIFAMQIAYSVCCSEQLRRNIQCAFNLMIWLESLSFSVVWAS